MCGLTCYIVQSFSLVLAQTSNINMCINQSQEFFLTPVRRTQALIETNILCDEIIGPFPHQLYGFSDTEHL